MYQFLTVLFCMITILVHLVLFYVCLSSLKISIYFESCISALFSMSSQKHGRKLHYSVYFTTFTTTPSFSITYPTTQPATSAPAVWSVIVRSCNVNLLSGPLLFGPSSQSVNQSLVKLSQCQVLHFRRPVFCTHTDTESDENIGLTSSAEVLTFKMSMGNAGFPR